MGLISIEGKSVIWLAATVIMVVAVISGGVFVYNRIYDRGYQAAKIEDEALMQRMKEANERAITAAEKALREDLANLKLEKDKLENEVKRLDDQADQDPHADTGGIKRSSVQRLNAIR